VVFGRLMPIISNSFKLLLWSQINSSPGGKITVDNSDGLLEFYDLAENRQHRGYKTVKLPLSFLPTYIKSAKGPQAVGQRLNEAKIEGKRFVEIVPRDFNTLPNAPGTMLRVDLRNRLNREVSGELKVTVPESATLKTAVQTISLQAGETKTLEFPMERAELSPANTYPCKFEFSSSAGNAEYSESLNAAVVVRGTKKVDGNLDDWAAVPGVTVAGSSDAVDFAELLRRPWIEVQKGDPGATSGEFKLAWDDDYFYIAARVNDPSPEPAPFRFSQRDENSYFHSAASDNISLSKNLSNPTGKDRETRNVHLPKSHTSIARTLRREFRFGATACSSALTSRLAAMTWSKPPRCPRGSTRSRIPITNIPSIGWMTTSTAQASCGGILRSVCPGSMIGLTRCVAVGLPALLRVRWSRFDERETFTCTRLPFHVLSSPISNSIRAQSLGSLEESATAKELMAEPTYFMVLIRQRQSATRLLSIPIGKIAPALPLAGPLLIR
jgi:hypothetical protein